MAYVDYRKTFDSIETWAVLMAMEEARIDSRYSRLIKSIYEGATLQVKLNDDWTTEKIPVKRGVRQGDTISPKLFTAALEHALKKLNWERKGISIDGAYLNHLRYADDIVLISESPDELVEMLQEFNEVSKEVGLTMNLSKTKAMGTDAKQIFVDGQAIENVSEYLGHNIKLGRENQTAELRRRIGLSWAAFGKLIVSLMRILVQYLQGLQALQGLLKGLTNQRFI